MLGLGLWVLTCLPGLGAGLQSDVLSQFTNYNVTCTSPSTNGSPGSMPIGNGDITANVWVENGGDLMLYIGKSDSWSEATRLLKIGRTRIHFSPNPFASGLPFNQTLNFYKGEIDITAGLSGSQVCLRLYVDANQLWIRIAAASQHNISLSFSYQTWRISILVMINVISDTFCG